MFMFESSDILKETKTVLPELVENVEFESSDILKGSKT